MSVESTELLDNDLRVILENLAEGLFPLNVWLNGNASTPPKKYIPPQKNLPWRATGHSLSPNDLGVIPFFETLLGESLELIAVLKRWHELRAEPLKFSPLVNPQRWRLRRGLNPTPQFGIAESNNVLQNPEGEPLVRAAFYRSYWPLLKHTVNAARPQSSKDWQSLGGNLFTDSCKQWPASQPLRSSVFVMQFARDMLYAMMGMHNESTHPNFPEYKFALLIELGEHRRIGNTHAPSDVEKALEQFKLIVNSFAVL